jgi:hypothetical protein
MRQIARRHADLAQDAADWTVAAKAAVAQQARSVVRMVPMSTVPSSR